MANNPTDFIDCAKNILAVADETENSARGAASRAYYGAFHAAKALQEKLILPPPTNMSGGSHQKLFNSLIECTPGHHSSYLVVRSIGYVAAATLKPYRVNADYRIDEDFTKKQAEEAIAKAQVVVEKAQAIIPSI